MVKCLGLGSLVWIISGFLAVTAIAQQKPEASNMALVGYNDLQGRGADEPVVKKQGERWIAYVGSLFGAPDRLNTLTGQVEPDGTSIIDVTDPKDPKYIAHIPGEIRPGDKDHGTPGPYPQGQAQYVQVCGGSELPHAEQGKFYLLRSFGNLRWEMYDVTDPAKPIKVTDVGPPLENLHEGTWECDTGVAYLPSGLYGWPLRTGTKHNAISHMAIWDLSNPAKPLLIRHWGLPGQNPGSTTQAPRGDLTTVISPTPQRNRLYIGYGNVSDGIWLILDRDKLLNGPKEPTDENLRYPVITRVDLPPEMSGHTPFPLFQMELPQFANQAGGKIKDFLVLIGEQAGYECQRGSQGEDGSAQTVRIYDITTETRPVGVSTWYVPEASGNFCSRAGRFGPHDQNIDFNPMYYKRLLFVTYGNAGVRAIDIRDPYHPTEIGYYIPAINHFTEEWCAGKENLHPGDAPCKITIQTNLVAVDGRGYIYIVDHNSTGMHILQLVGSARQVADFSQAQR